MLNRIIRIIAILLTAVAACVALPRLFNMFFSPHSEHHEVEYSELLNDFIRSEYEYHNDNGKLSVTSVYFDSMGRKYSSAQADSLCPLDNASQLAYEDKFPDTICGKPVVAKEAGDAKFRMNISSGRPSLFYGLSELKDRKSSVSARYENDDLFRINRRGIEFIAAATNSVNAAKSEEFNSELAQLGFEAPAAIWWAPADRTEFEKHGYIVIDAKGDAFNLAMENRKPSAKRVNLPGNKKIATVSFSNRADFPGIATDEEGNLYIINQDMRCESLPLPSIRGKSATLMANLMFLTFIVYDKDRTSYHVLSRDYTPVKSISVENKREVSVRDKIASYIFSVAIYQDSTRGIQIIFGNPLHFIWLNIILAAATYFIRRREGYPLNDILSIIETIVVLLFGIFGMAGVFAIPRRKKSNQ